VAPLKLSDAEEQLHLLGKSPKVSESHEHSPISLPKPAIHKIEIIATTPNSRKAFQDGTVVSTVVRYGGSTDNVRWKYGKVRN